MTKTVELGIDTFGDVTVDANGQMLPHAQVIRNLLDEAILADQTGVDFIGVGEHHRGDFAISSPETMLAGIATRTNRIRLGSAVTVLSSDDPIRVFQRFSTVDALSNGRAEVILGRGSFTESFPLFGYDLSKYEELFSEKLDLFAALLKNGPVTWEGPLRPPLKDVTIYPPIENGQSEGLDRRRRQPGIRGAFGAVSNPDDAGDHRRRSETVQAVCRSLSEGAGSAGR
jgi:alkanesulfonate monooxygenase SsuD/methylene tetrahydromethanopterin reductase-like flavin-dependent oxidoreductase (luciferase family)